MVDKSLAWKELSSLKNSAGIGASSANYLLWTASRSVTKWNNMTATEMQIFDNTEADSTSIRADCSANSACRALG